MSYSAEFAHGDETKRVSARHLSGTRYQIQVGDALHEVDAIRLPDGRVRFTMNDRTLEADAAPCAKSQQVRVDGQTWLLTPAKRGGAGGGEASGDIEAQMSGTIAKVLVSNGDTVEVGDPIVVLTAMKMEHKLCAGIAGTVGELSAAEGETVDQGVLLARVTPTE